MTGIKICGIATEEALAACIEARVDWVGFVFFPPSPRHVTTAAASRLASRLPASIAAVGLVVSPADDELDRITSEVPLAALQLYGTPARAASLRQRLPIEVWHALPIASKAELPVQAYAGRFLIEARTGGTGRPGGNGASLDWAIFSGWRPPAPWMLAGGLTPANVAGAIARSGAPAVDVSSGVEKAPGQKDPGLIRSFVDAVRASAPRPPQ